MNSYQVKQYQLKNIPFIEITTGTLKVVFSSLGASIYSLQYKGKEMVHRPKHFEDWIKPSSYYGKTIGRVAGRIKGNKISIDNKEYLIENNEGDNTLHGGVHGLSNCLFNMSLKTDYENIEVVYHHICLEKMDGFPGDLDVEVHYLVNITKSTINTKYFAKSNQKSLVSLTNHSYFTLGEEDLSWLILKVPSNKFVDVNKEDLIPLRYCKLLPCLDFNKGRLLTEDIDNNYLTHSRTNGYDHYLCFSNSKEVILESPKIRLEITTDFPGIQIYSDNYYDFEEMNTSKRIHRSLAIEPEDLPLSSHIVNKNEIYSRFITYTFKDK